MSEEKNETIEVPVEIRVTEEPATPGESAEQKEIAGRRRGVIKLASHLLIEWSGKKPNCSADMVEAMAPQALEVAVAISNSEDSMEQLLE